MKKLNVLDWVALVLVVVGGLNWGLVAMKFNLVDFLFGSWPWLTATVYALVGLSALWMIVVAVRGDKSGPQM
jgi:uncharacterized membrane protein YuzA (DUF378 family)